MELCRDMSICDVLRVVVPGFILLGAISALKILCAENSLIRTILVAGG